MISVANLTKAYGLQVVFDNISFTVGDGERLGVVGRNGSGKTTLLRLMVGQEEPDSGQISLPRNYSVGYLSQVQSFTGPTVLSEACVALKKSEDGIDETYRVKSILIGLGFDQREFSKHPGELSNGYQIRLDLAKVLVAQPNLLLLDEPTNYLDIVSVRWLAGFLRQWKNEVILITHDRAFMDSVVTHVLGIYRSGVRKIAGSTHKLYQQILQEEEVYEKTRLNDEKKRKDLLQFIERFRAQASRAKAVQSKIKTLERHQARERLVQLKDLDFEFPYHSFSGKWVADIRNATFSYDPAGEALVRDLSFSIARNDRIAVIGKNGKGKTTLLNLIAGELAPSTGSVDLHVNARIAYFGTANIDRLNPGNTIEDEILQAHPESSRAQVRNICGAMLFDGDKALKKIEVLSGGERSRTLLGKLLAVPASLLLLDEPTNHLDQESVDSLIEAIDAFDGAVVIATHSEMVLRAVARRLIVFDGGMPWLFEGSYQDFLERVGWKDEEPAEGRMDDLGSKKNRGPRERTSSGCARNSSPNGAGPCRPSRRR